MTTEWKDSGSKVLVMSDKELLELAAIAAGFQVERLSDDESALLLSGIQDQWNPLVDDGDALRLAVRLGLVVDCSRPSAGLPYGQHSTWMDELMGNQELTRRSIVLAAAAVGKQLPADIRTR